MREWCVLRLRQVVVCVGTLRARDTWLTENLRRSHLQLGPLHSRSKPRCGKRCARASSASCQPRPENASCEVAGLCRVRQCGAPFGRVRVFGDRRRWSPSAAALQWVAGPVSTGRAPLRMPCARRAQLGSATAFDGLRVGGGPCCAWVEV